MVKEKQKNKSKLDNEKSKINDYEKNLKSEKIKQREIKIKIVRIAILITIIFLIIIYFLLRTVYDLGDFTISLDPQSELKSGLVMYESKDTKEHKQILKANKLEFMDNISINWLPDNLNNEADGGHNGENYIAYTFYIENQGSDIINYWYNIHIDDVIKNVDSAVRVMVYRNEDRKIYAKVNSNTNMPEAGTTPFYSNDEVLMEQRTNFNPGDIDKFTIVIWLEGDDPDCVDAIIGGEMKMTMEITEEHIQ